MGTTSSVCEDNRDWHNWSACRIFVIALLACTIVTSLGVMILCLVYFGDFYNHRITSNKPTTDTTEPASAGRSSRVSPEGSPSKTAIDVDPRYQFLYHLGASKEYSFKGGALQCGRYWKNLTTYSSAEEMAFGTSLHSHQSKMSVCILNIKRGGLRVPNWNINANVHGLVLKGLIWSGVVDSGGATAVTYNATTGQVIFFPQNTLYWIKNIGSTVATILTFFSTHEEVRSLELDNVLKNTPEYIVSRTLMPIDGLDCISGLFSQHGGDILSPPSNFSELTLDPTYPESAKSLIWQYLYNFRGAKRLVFKGGQSQWARCYTDPINLSQRAAIFSQSLRKGERDSSTPAQTFYPGSHDYVLGPDKETEIS
ncbi:dynactin-associated protein [Lissotriton helveticus]